MLTHCFQSVNKSLLLLLLLLVAVFNVNIIDHELRRSCNQKSYWIINSVPKCHLFFAKKEKNVCLYW